MASSNVHYVTTEQLGERLGMCPTRVGILLKRTRTPFESAEGTTLVRSSDAAAFVEDLERGRADLAERFANADADRKALIDQIAAAAL